MNKVQFDLYNYNLLQFMRAFQTVGGDVEHCLHNNLGFIENMPRNGIKVQLTICNVGAA